jgi:hypothetical protein
MELGGRISRDKYVNGKFPAQLNLFQLKTKQEGVPGRTVFLAPRLLS